ncbi:hypothetical protein BDK51DRAFT_28148 [Blyttiomyces helicus]|uniref:Uncharacterized protein n=1 Tax=Blyttiomyces helicus TaxID=388810 RepID=A0A4P9WA78_9FUNG|nr:hypothetical protein BDK51DRAFT_28148 [Blyttiomyces helicus]|eukprot:RKO89489.1 hypothetical protein BDK51DRAFT_28148 [Blyttiomyces helicus]
MHVWRDDEGVMRGGEWGEPRFEVEPLCMYCWSKCRFCSRCGGGGKFRTGKWRPRELFENSKKTCSLSHLRTGNISFEYDLRRCPNAVTPSELTAVGQCWRELGMQTYAQAREMESNLGLQSLGTVVERVRASAEEAMRFVADAAAAPNGQRYVVLVWEAAARKVGKCKHATTRSQPLPPLTPSPQDLSSLPAPRRHLRGFQSAELDLELDLERAVLFFGFSQFSSRSQVILAETLITLFRGIMDDAGIAPQNFARGPIKHVWWTQRRPPPGSAFALSIEKRAHFRAMGFVPLAAYCTEFRTSIDEFARGKEYESPFFEQFAAPFVTVYDWTRTLAAREH